MIATRSRAATSGTFAGTSRKSMRSWPARRSYAGALPGSLKNLLEWTVGDGGTYRKPVAWINVSGPAAPTGGTDAHDSLRKVLGYVHADIVEPACTRVRNRRVHVYR